MVLTQGSSPKIYSLGYSVCIPNNLKNQNGYSVCIPNNLKNQNGTKFPGPYENSVKNVEKKIRPSISLSVGQSGKTPHYKFKLS